MQNLFLHKTWDKELEYSKETSDYYARMVKVFGQAMADYYWDRRFEWSKLPDKGNWIDICKEISGKCDKFLKDRGVEVENVYINGTINWKP